MSQSQCGWSSSDQLQIVGLVRPLPHQLPNLTSAAPKARGQTLLLSPRFHPQIICGISTAFAALSPPLGTFRCITHPFATRQRPKACYRSTCM